jgi:hypothetical protein
MTEHVNTQNENFNGEPDNLHTQDNESQMPNAVDKRLFQEYVAQKQVGKYLKHHTNTIAKAMKILAIVFWTASTVALIISRIQTWGDNLNYYADQDGQEIAMTIASLCANLLITAVIGAIIFALGEVIQILHDIRAGKAAKGNGDR